MGTESITVMTTEDVGFYGNTTLSDDEAQLCKSEGTTVSAIHYVNLIDIAEATVSGKVDEQQSKFMAHWQ